MELDLGGYIGVRNVFIMSLTPLLALTEEQFKGLKSMEYFEFLDFSKDNVATFACACTEHQKLLLLLND